jgi:geranylgeranyl diphosphate synthase, type I
MTSFTSYLQQEATVSKQVLAKYLKSSLAPFHAVDPTFAGFLSPLPGYLTTGGKWLRPLLVRLGYGIAGGKQAENVVLGSLTSEVFHRFILSHDDIIDGDTLRHGQATLETQYEAEGISHSYARPLPNYGQAMAIIAGDVLHSLVTDMIVASNFSPPITQALLKGYHRCLMETAAGWRLETMLKQQALSQVTPKQVEQAMFLVSASYSIIWPLRLGYLMAGKKMGQWDGNLEDFGKHAGMAFQIIDDMLGFLERVRKQANRWATILERGKNHS